MLSTGAKPTANLILERLGDIARELEAHNAQLCKFGAALLGVLGTHPVEVLGNGVTSQATHQLHEQAGKAFLAKLCGLEAELRAAGDALLVEWDKATEPYNPDASLLAAAYGMTFPAKFSGDLRLKYRTNGYRGKPGDPLADHFIATVIADARKALGR